jgi:hypothetical protein
MSFSLHLYKHLKKGYHVLNVKRYVFVVLPLKAVFPLYTFLYAHKSLNLVKFKTIV